jgi:hypothetical protein
MDALFAFIKYMKVALLIAFRDDYGTAPHSLFLGGR